jgi:hypothetical protein
MNSITHDRDLLRIEPGIYLGGGFASRTLTAGTDGQLSDTAFTSASADFLAAGLAAGMVLCTWSDAPEEPSPVEIVSVNSATSLTVSVLRESDDAVPVGPSPGSDLGYFVRSYRPEIRQAADRLAQLLSTSRELREDGRPAFLDTAPLRRAIAVGSLATIFDARSDGAPDSADGIKARHYRRLWTEVRTQLRVAVDSDGDGRADQMRTLSHVTLRRI